MAAYGLIGLADGVGGVDGAGDMPLAAGSYQDPQAPQQGAAPDPAQLQLRPQPLSQPQPAGQGAQVLQSWLQKTRQEYQIPGGAGAAADTGAGTAAGADMGLPTGDGGNAPQPLQQQQQQQQQRQQPPQQPRPMPVARSAASPQASPAYAAAGGGRDFSSLWR